MRRAVDKQDPAARASAEQQLADAQRKLEGALQSQTGSSLSQLAKETEELARRQQELADKVKRQYGAEGINMADSQGQSKDGSDVRMPEMSGPGYGSWWYARRFGEQPDRFSTPAEKKLAGESEKLAKDTEALEKKLQQQAMQMPGEQREPRRKLEQALSQAEQRELAVRMQKNSEWLKRGYGSETWPLEDSITAGMQQLSRQVQDAEQALANGNGKGQDRAGRTLDEIQRLRDDVASGRPTIGGGRQQAMDDLAALGREDQSLRSYADDAMGSLQRLYGQNGLLDERLNERALRSLDRLQLELSRRVGQTGPAAAHAGVSEESPEAYRESVAEYFRRISK